MKDLQKEEISKKVIGNMDYPKLELLLKRTQVWANVFICFQIVLIIIALFQYCDAKDYNRNQIESAKKNELIAKENELSKNAIEAINRIYNTEFLNNFAKLDKKSTLINEETRNAFLIVLNNYYIVSVIYNSGIANNNLIEESIKSGIKTFTGYPIYDSSKVENLESAKKSIDDMMKKFNINMK